MVRERGRGQGSNWAERASDIVSGMIRSSRPTLRRWLRIGAVCVVSMPLVLLFGLEVAYRVTLARLALLELPRHRPILSSRVLQAIWTAEGGRGVPVIPRMYPWRLDTIMGNEFGSRFAWRLARGPVQVVLVREEIPLNSFERHLLELDVGAWLSRTLSTEEILTAYAESLWMNRAGRGLEAASRYYFDRPLDKLDIGQLALLLAVSESPRALDPREHPERALGARDCVLKRFSKSDYLTDAQLAAALAMPLGIETASRPQ